MASYSFPKLARDAINRQQYIEIAEYFISQQTEIDGIALDEELLAAESLRVGFLERKLYFKELGFGRHHGAVVTHDN
ncbi:hypothetical protein Pla144_41930 [Bythopirellula polymerisocia]|uniref:Uncharacterized protein n=1 Tax=Bythopirellula polymerisocia TaxID=2528003 RepID=A0A5C6CF39_9BACT|nr:hypothetical protein Pla144_41930 [Bythopirellula polymerisocia]